MLTNGHTEARKLRSRLNHPIIDADGHWAEFAPLMREEFRRIGGDTAVEALAMASRASPTRSACPWPSGVAAGSARKRSGSCRPRTRSTGRRPCCRASVRAPRRPRPRLLRGLSHRGLGYYRLPPEQLRRALCRAYNVFTAEQFRPYNDRIIPAAIIPMYSPEEAIEELEFASKQLG